MLSICRVISLGGVDYVERGRFCTRSPELVLYGCCRKKSFGLWNAGLVRSALGFLEGMLSFSTIALPPTILCGWIVVGFLATFFIQDD